MSADTTTAILREMLDKTRSGRIVWEAGERMPLSQIFCAVTRTAEGRTLRFTITWVRAVEATLVLEDAETGIIRWAVHSMNPELDPRARDLITELIREVERRTASGKQPSDAQVLETLQKL